MTAADTVTSPWPTAARNWTKRRDDDEVLQVYRLIANAGPTGIARAHIRTRMPGIEEAVVNQHLQELRKKGHARYVGDNGSTRYGKWVATPVPWPDEPPPAWIAELAAEETNDLAPPPGAADAAVDAARNVPNSVFALGVAAEVDIDAVHSSRPAPPADGAPPPPTKPVPSPDIVVALDNHGRLLVHEDGTQPVVLSPETTRALFTYLDRTVMGASGPILTEALP